MKGLLLQLLEIKLGHPALHQRLATTFSKAVQPHASSDLEGPLWDDLEAVLATLSNVVLVIDGLDELEEEQDTLAMVTRLAAVAKSAGPGPRQSKIICTSRPMQAQPPADFEKFVIEPKHTRADVLTYVNHCIQQLSTVEKSPFHRMDDADRKAIESQVVERADGMILWAKLVIEEMGRKKSVPQMTKSLDHAPGKLTELYAKLYESLDKSNGDTQKVFPWLLCAQRPLNLDELETVLQVDLDTLSLCERLTQIVHDLQDACGPFVEVHQRQVKLVHHSVRQWMLGIGKLGYSAQACHKDVWNTSLTYLAIILPEKPTRIKEPLPTNPVREIHQQNIAQLCEDYALLDYAASFWPVHLQRSMPPKDSDDYVDIDRATRSILTAIHGLSLLEIIQWNSYFAPMEAKDLCQYAYLLRLSVYGAKHLESVQNGINLAAIYEAAADYESASIEYREAWLSCRSMLGDQEPCTYNCANSYALNLEKAGKGEAAEEAYEWMWKSRQQVLGVDHEETLMIAARLAWLYQRHEQFQKANDTYREIWELWVNKLGHLDEHTILAAGYYARALQFIGENDKAVEVYDARMAVAGNRYAKTSQKYVASVIAMAQALEYAGMQTQSEKLMLDLSENLVVAESGDSKAYALIQLDLEVARFYVRQERVSEARNLLETRWAWCKMVLDLSNTLSDRQIALIEDLAREMEMQKAWSEALDIISWLRQYHDRALRPRSDPSLKTLFWMAQIFADDRQIADERGILQEAFRITSFGGSYDTATLEAARHLGLFYYRAEDWIALEELCKQILGRVWPSVLTKGPYMLPNDQRTSALSVARQLALSYQKEEIRLGCPGSYDGTKLLNKAEQLYVSIAESYKVSIGLGDPNTIGAIVEVGKFYESRRKYEKAQVIFEGVLESNRTVLGPSHYLTTRSWFKLAKFFERRADWDRSQQVYEGLLQQVSKDWGLGHPLAAETSLNLDRIYYRQGKLVTNGGAQTHLQRDDLEAIPYHITRKIDLTITRKNSSRTNWRLLKRSKACVTDFCRSKGCIPPIWAAQVDYRAPS